MVKSLHIIILLSLFYSYNILCLEFPKILHFIWLGGVPYSSNEANVKQWIENNPNYQIYIWYSGKDLDKREELGKIRSNNNQSFLDYIKNETISKNKVIDYFKRQFNADNVEIKDLENFNELCIQEDENSLMMDKNNFFLTTDTKKNLIDSFYDELIIQESCPNGINLAAASDIARILLLYYYGGVYFDFDVYSRSDFILNIEPNLTGFKISGTSQSTCITSVNNNLLASIPYGEIVVKIAQTISNNYLKLKRESTCAIYPDDRIALLYTEISQSILESIGDNKYIYISDLKDMICKKGVVFGFMTRLQKKKFADVPYYTKIGGTERIINKKFHMTTKISGPEVIYKNLIIKDGDSFEVLCFPSDYIGPCDSEGKGWSQ